MAAARAGSRRRSPRSRDVQTMLAEAEDDVLAVYDFPTDPLA
jgi:hypothetical protein